MDQTLDNPDPLSDGNTKESPTYHKEIDQPLHEMDEANDELDVEWKEPDFENGWDQEEEQPTKAVKWKDGVSNKSKNYITLDDILDHTAPDV